MSNEKIVEFAKKNGYDNVLPLGPWREYECYEPTFDGATEEEPAIVGPPLIILVKGDEIRMSTEEEAFQQMDETDTDEIEEV